MHIGMILSTPLPPTEGIGFYSWNLARFLVRQGHEVTLITRGSQKESWCEKVDGITIWWARFLPVYPLHVHLHSLFVNRLVQDLDTQVDVWHLHTPLVKFPRTRRPVLVTIHTPMKADTSKIPVKNFYSLAIRLQSVVSLQLETELFKKAKQLVSVSNSVADELQAYGVLRQNVRVLGNGADTDIFYPGNSQRDDAAYFFTAGRLAPRKGLEDLVRCAGIVTQKYPQYQFLVAGSGPLEHELRDQIDSAGLQNNVRLIGHITDRTEMNRLYQNAVAYIHPAHYEGLPTVLLEAMACGIPVITTAVSGALDVVQDGVNGLLVPPHKPDILANTIFSLLETPALGERLGKAACQTIRQHYSWEVISKKYLAQYQTLVQGRSG